MQEEEESILPSPSNKSIHKFLNIRRCKRKLSVADNHDNTNATTTFYHHLCRDDDEDSSSPENLNKTFLCSRINDYKSFGMETILCIADRVPSSNLKKRTNLPQNNHQGFLTCQRITTEQQNESDNSFVITDSELLNCCYEVDEMLMNTPPLSKRLCIVNAILEDFSLSPLSTKPEKNLSRFWEYSPQFVLKSKPTKTYSRKRHGTEDCNKRLEFNKLMSSSDDEDCMSNNSSYLSIQENNSQLEDMFNTTVMPDISERLNENLLNLSDFYTQESLTSNIRRRRSSSVEAIPSVDENSENMPSNVVVNLMKDICSLREHCSQKPLCSNSYSSDQEFHGFLNIARDVEQEISLSEECCGVPLLNTTLLSPQSLHIPDEDREMVLIPQGDTESITYEGYEFADDYKDEWNTDCEFALTKTQKVLLDHKNSSYKNPTKTSDSFQQNTTTVDLIDSIKTSLPISKTLESSRNLLDQNYNINTKDETYSKDATKQTEDRILHQRMGSNVFESINDVGNRQCNESIEKPNIFDMPSTSKAAMKANIERNNGKLNGREISSINILKNEIIQNVGFQTANGKVVNISKKAQKSVEKLLKEFNKDCGEDLERDLEAIKNEIIHKNAVNIAAKSHKSSENRLKDCRENIDQNFDIVPNDNVDVIGHKTTEPVNIITNPQASIGFQTANGKIVSISTKAKRGVDKLLREFYTEADDNNEQKLSLLKNEINHKNSKISLPHTELIRNESQKEYWEDENDLADVVFSEWPLVEQLQSQSINSKSVENCKKDSSICEYNKNCLLSPLVNNMSTNNLEGFQTAGGKPVAISAKSKNVVANLLQDIQTNCDIKTYEHNLIEIKKKMQSKNNEMKMMNNSQSYRLNNTVNTMTVAETYDSSASTFEGFQTAGGKKLTMSDKAKKVVANLLQDIGTDYDIKTYEQDLVEIKNKMQSKNCELKVITNSGCSKTNNTTKTISTIELKVSAASSLDVVKNSMDSGKTFLPLLTTKLEGFQTAGGKKVTISDNAKKVVANLLQDIGTDCDIKTYEQDLVEIKYKMQSKNCELKAINNSVSSKTNNTTKTINILEQNDFPASPLVVVKRPLDSENTPLPPAKKTLLIDGKQSFSELSVQSPLNNSAAKSVISRKNLLSLSKKRKQRSRFSVRTVSNNSSNNNHPEDEERNENPIISIHEQAAETPVKKKPFPAVQTPCTPTINEFFNNAQKSSTPRTDVCIKPAPQILENDLKRISWEVANNSSLKPAISTKLSDDTCSNITLNSSNPTANERIGRLQMYGNAPAVSPITIDTHNNCRPSGLRRTRSMFRKSNN